jgi:hypothetical protein
LFLFFDQIGVDFIGPKLLLILKLVAKLLSVPKVPNGVNAAGKLIEFGIVSFVRNALKSFAVDANSLCPNQTSFEYQVQPVMVPYPQFCNNAYANF